MNRTLILMRHAKSAWPVGVRDLERPLNSRGRRNAETAGAWLGKHYPIPDRIVVSPAIRTRQTWALVSTAAKFTPETASFDPRIYEASWWDLLDLIRESADAAQAVMLIGHNPAFEDLTEELAGAGEPDFLQQLRAKFPTSAIAVLESAEPWPRWGSNCAFLKDLEIP